MVDGLIMELERQEEVKLRDDLLSAWQEIVRLCGCGCACVCVCVSLGVSLGVCMCVCMCCVCVCACMCVSVCVMYMCSCLKRPEESIGAPWS